MKSGIQKEVLSLYRRALRMVRGKPLPARSKFLLFVRYNFHMQSKSVSPRNVGAIEHLIRKGTRQIEMYEDKAVKDCWVSMEMQLWDRERKGPQNLKRDVIINGNQTIES